MTAVAELIGIPLDYWAGKAAKLDVRFDSDMTVQNRQVLYVHTNPWNGADMPSMDRYSPSQWWNQGGPLIEEHTIAIAKGANQICFPGWHAKVGLVNAYDTNTGRQFGPTPLIAAMRALVWSVYGDNVPDEVNP